MSGNFGHVGYIGKHFCVDSWGVGPFHIVADDRKTYRFEDSDQFGPSLITRRGDIASKQPGERSPFWRAHWLWVRQGRQLDVDGRSCIWRAPKPTFWTKKGRQIVLVERGEDDGQNILDGKIINFGDQP
jgi:hypothetical protein